MQNIINFGQFFLCSCIVKSWENIVHTLLDFGYTQDYGILITSKVVHVVKKIYILNVPIHPSVNFSISQNMYFQFLHHQYQWEMIQEIFPQVIQTSQSQELLSQIQVLYMRTHHINLWWKNSGRIILLIQVRQKQPHRGSLICVVWCNKCSVYIPVTEVPMQRLNKRKRYR